MNFQKQKTYALVDQLRRATVSIPSNIAEGFDRRTSKEFLQFLRMAFASSAEVWAQLTIAHKLDYVTREELILTMNNLEEIRKMLAKLIASIKQKCSLTTNH